MAAPTVRAYATATNGTDAAPAFTVTAPAGVASGDLLLAFCANDTTGTAWTTSPGNGWTKLSDEVQGSTHRLAVYALIADGSDGLSTAAANNNDYSCVMVAIQVGTHGVTDVNTDIIIPAAATNSTGNADPPASGTVASKDWLAIAAMAADFTNAGDSVSAYPTNYGNGVLTKSASSTSSVGLGVGHRALTAATSENPGTFTNTSRPWVAKTLLIPPPPPTEVVLPPGIAPGISLARLVAVELTAQPRQGAAVAIAAPSVVTQPDLAAIVGPSAVGVGFAAPSVVTVEVNVPVAPTPATAVAVASPSVVAATAEVSAVPPPGTSVGIAAPPVVTVVSAAMPVTGFSIGISLATTVSTVITIQPSTAHVVGVAAPAVVDAAVESTDILPPPGVAVAVSSLNTVANILTVGTTPGISIGLAARAVVSASSSVTGTVAVTQANQTATASGQLGYTGSATVVQEDQISTATGQLGTSGTGSVTQENQTSTASGGTGTVGTVAVTQADQTSTASGSSGIQGSSAQTQEHQFSTATGTALDPISGTVAITQADQVSSASGVVTGVTIGAAAVTEENDSCVAFGTSYRTTVTVGGMVAGAPRSDTRVSAALGVPSVHQDDSRQTQVGAGVGIPSVDDS